jgi:hypothetical protein
MRVAGVSFVLMAWALAACGQQEAKTYPPQYALNFMQNCRVQAGASVALCACMWEKIEREIAPDDFTAFERLPAAEQATSPLRAQITAYADECRAETAEPPEDPPAP